MIVPKILALCLISTALAEDLELTDRRYRLRKGVVHATGKVENVSGRTIDNLRVYVAMLTKHGDMVRSMTEPVEVRRFWIRSSRRLEPKSKGRFEVKIPYHQDMKLTLMCFTVDGVLVTHRRVKR